MKVRFPDGRIISSVVLEWQTVDTRRQCHITLSGILGVGYASRPEFRCSISSRRRIPNRGRYTNSHVSRDDLMRIPTKCDSCVHRQNKPTARPVSGSSPTSQNPVKTLVRYRNLSIGYRTDLAGFQGQAWSACPLVGDTRSQPLPKVSRTESE
jgi:hypothetical protein